MLVVMVFVVVGSSASQSVTWMPPGGLKVAPRSPCTMSANFCSTLKSGNGDSLSYSTLVLNLSNDGNGENV